MFNSYAALLINTPSGAPLTDRLVPHFAKFCDASSPEYWPELVVILREQHPSWFSASGEPQLDVPVPAASRAA